jgi:hypothetical protein
VTDGVFLPDGSFLSLPAPDPHQLMLLFRHKLLQELLFLRTFASHWALTFWRPYAMGVFFPCFDAAFPHASGTIAEQKLSKISPFVHFSALFQPGHCSMPPFSPFGVHSRPATSDLIRYNSLMLRSSEKA